VVWMTADLLVPLRLDRGGYDVAAIGVAFSLSSLVFVAASALTARGADRWARPGIAAAATAGLAVCTALPAFLVGVPIALVFLFGASVTTGVIGALTFPFGLHAVDRGHVTVAVMTALANIIWAVSGIAGPTVGGAFAEWAGDQAAFAVLASVCLVVTLVVARQARTAVAR
jgi:MFS family permease